MMMHAVVRFFRAREIVCYEYYCWYLIYLDFGGHHSCHPGRMVIKVYPYRTVHCIRLFFRLKWFVLNWYIAL